MNDITPLPVAKREVKILSPKQKIARNAFVWLAEPIIFYWTLVGMHSGILRREYVIRTEELNSKIFFDELAANDNTELLTALIGQRNQLKHEIRERGNPMFKAWAEHRNTLKYGDKLGPDYNFLLKKQQDKHPDWPVLQQRTYILKGVARTNEEVNSSAAILEYGGYTFAVLLLLRLLLSMAWSARGEGLLSGLQVLGSWLLGGLGVLIAVSFSVQYAHDSQMFWVALVSGISLSFVLVFIWDMIFKALFSKLQTDIKAIDKLRP
jgi:hypothetical protein